MSRVVGWLLWAVVMFLLAGVLGSLGWIGLLVYMLVVFGTGIGLHRLMKEKRDDEF